MYKSLLFLIPFFCLSVLPSQAQIRINEVSHGTVDFQGSSNWLELYNAGTEAVDVSDLFLCDFPAYPRISSLTVLSGSMTIPSEGYLVVSWTNIDDDAEIGLYTSDTNNFGNADFVLDYMQYGSAGHTRESAAVTAGVWATGEFLELAMSGETLQFVEGNAAGASSWMAAASTPGEANSPVATSNDEFDSLPEAFSLNGNFPNPFNPTTTISYELSNAGQVNLVVYDILGRQVISLVNGQLPAGEYESTWNGLDANGNVVPSGTYLYRLTFGEGQSQSRVMTLLK